MPTRSCLRHRQRAAPPRTGALPSGFRPTRRRPAPLRTGAGCGSAPGKPPSRAPPARRAFCIAHSSAASTGVVVGVDVVAVETQAGFETQRIAGAEADRHDIGMFENPAGHVFSRCGRDGNLKAVLAGIARARDDAGNVVQAASATSMKRMVAISAQSSARTHSARGPCSAISARSSSRVSSQVSPRCS